jgi:hypothetical protein
MENLFDTSRAELGDAVNEMHEPAEDTVYTNAQVEVLSQQMNYSESMVAYSTNTFSSNFVEKILLLFKEYPHECHPSRLTTLLPLVPLLESISPARVSELVKIGHSHSSSILLETVRELKKRYVKNPMVPFYALRKEGFTTTFIENGCRAENFEGDYVEWKFRRTEAQLSYKLGGKTAQHSGLEFQFKLACMAFVDCKFNVSPPRIALIPNFAANASKFFPNCSKFSNLGRIIQEFLRGVTVSGCRQYADCFGRILNSTVSVNIQKEFEKFIDDVKPAVMAHVDFVEKNYSGPPTRELFQKSINLVTKVNTPALDAPQALRGGRASLSNSLFKSFEYEWSPATPGVSTYHKWLNVVEKIKKSKFFIDGEKKKTVLVSFGHTKENHWSVALNALEADLEAKFDVRPATTDVHAQDVFTWDVAKFIKDNNFTEDHKIIVVSDIQKDGDTTGDEMKKLIDKYHQIYSEFQKVAGKYVVFAFKLQWVKRSDTSNLMSYQTLLDKISLPCVVYDEGTRGHNGEVLVLLGDTEVAPTKGLTENVKKATDAILVSKSYVKTTLRTALLFIGCPILPSKSFESDSYLSYLNQQRDNEAQSKNAMAEVQLQSSLNTLFDNVEGDAEEMANIFNALG